jgi:UDP:flavonoid glycosyltransferase YjiC (YdhE family)
LNPIACVMEELIQKHNVKVYFFGNQKYKQLIDKIGAEYKEYSFFDMDLVPSNNEKFDIGEFYRVMMKFASDLLPELFKFCQEERPNLILMDHMSLHTKYLRNFLIIQDKKKKLDFPLPKFVNFYSSFAMLHGIYPTKEDMKTLMGKFDFKLLIELFRIPYRQKKINKRLGLNFKLDVKGIFEPIEEVNICCILMELQPKADNLIHRFKFPGLCIAEHVRNIETGNQKLNEILNIFPEINPYYLCNNKEVSNNEHKKLVYVSLGTVAYNRIDVFERIIEAFRIFDDEPKKTKSNVKLDDLEVVITVGKEPYQTFNDKVKNENYNLPSNLYLAEFSPQIEILKRASLFLTHAGCNSIGETIYYGVPVICLPLQGDQPLAAQRVCDELNFGKKLDFKTFTPDQLRSCLHEVLSKDEYRDNVLEFTEISRRSNGIKNTADIIMNVLEQTN